MSEQERRVPGERLVERMERRTRRRPRLGMSPAFYSRLGLEDPWAIEGADCEAPVGGDGMVFVSAAPYYAMLQKLATARRRRERRMQRFLERRSGTKLRAAGRAWPGEALAAGRLPLPKVAALSASDMQLPAAAAAMSTPAAESLPAAEGRTERSGWGRPARVAPQAWLDSPYAPARVARTPGARPMERVGERLVSARRAEADAGLEASLPRSTARQVARARRAIEIEEAAPVELSGAQVVRVVRRAKVARPVVRIVEEEIAPPTSPRPAQIATTRMVDGASRGLRPLALRSPAMAVATADLAHAADVDRATALALAAPERGESMRPAAARRIPLSQRASARGDGGRPGGQAEAPLSASPVSSSRTATARPVAASPVARASARDGGAGGAAASPTLRAPVARLAASAAAVARLSHAQAPSLARPLDTTTARDDSEATSDPAGTAASPRRRAPATSLAARRDEVGQPTASLVPRPVAHARRVASPAAAHPPGDAPAGATGLPNSAPVASPGARFVPARLARAMRTAASAPHAVPVAPPASAAVQDAAPVDAGRRDRPAGGPEPTPSRRPDAVTPVASSATVVRSETTPPGDRPLRAAREAVTLEATAPRSPRTASTPAPGAVERRASVSLTPSTTWAAARIATPTVGAAPAQARSIVPRAVVPAHLARHTAADAPTATAVEAGGRVSPARSVAGASRAHAGAEPPVVAASRSLDAPPSTGTSVPRGSHTPAMTPVRPATPVTVPRAQAASPADRAERREAVPAPAPRPARRERPAPVAAAASRADHVARALADATLALDAPAAPGAVRRSGPLSWAQPRASSPMVASFSTPSSPTARAGRGASRPAAAASARHDTPAAVLPLGTAATRPIIEELAARGLLANTYSPSTPVRTPDGRYVSARVAEALPGLAVLPSVTGPVAVAATPVQRAPGFRTPEVRFVGAPTSTTASTAYTGAATRRTRPTEWVAARTGVTGATAYRGAIAVGTDEATFRPARSVATPATAFVGATTATTPTGDFTGARSARGPAAVPAVTRPRTLAAAPATLSADAGADFEPGPATPTPTTRRRRPPVEATFMDVATDSPVASSAPNWAARAEGRPLVRSAQGLFDSLARATTAEQVVSVIAQRAGGFTSAVPITEPMREVVEAIRQEIAAPAEVAQPAFLSTRAPEVEAPRTTVLRGTRVEPVRSSARTSRGSVRPVRSAAVTRGPGGGDDRISKLVKRLTDLIHLAEDQRRLSEAQSQVRMAEDTPAARAEGGAPMGQSAAGGVKLDIETFTREVLEVVNRELELRRERRMEDGDESGWW